MIQKAKAYAARYRADPSHTTMADIAVDFDKETNELIKSRNVTTDKAFKAVLTELDTKWQSFARLVSINPDGYKLIMYKLHPTTAAFAWPDFKPRLPAAQPTAPNTPTVNEQSEQDEQSKQQA